MLRFPAGAPYVVRAKVLQWLHLITKCFECCSHMSSHFPGHRQCDCFVSRIYDGDPLEVSSFVVTVLSVRTTLGAGPSPATLRTSDITSTIYTTYTAIVAHNTTSTGGSTSHHLLHSEQHHPSTRASSTSSSLAHRLRS